MSEKSWIEQMVELEEEHGSPFWFVDGTPRYALGGVGASHRRRMSAAARARTRVRFVAQACTLEVEQVAAQQAQHKEVGVPQPSPSRQSILQALDDSIQYRPNRDLVDEQLHFLRLLVGRVPPEVWVEACEEYAVDRRMRGVADYSGDFVKWRIEPESGEPESGGEPVWRKP